MDVTKKTEKFDACGEKTETTKERRPTPKPIYIYQLYENFAESPHLSVSPIRPKEGTYVRGTLKRSDAQYYYIANNYPDR
jgi:hypothetical protein